MRQSSVSSRLRGRITDIACSRPHIWRKNSVTAEYRRSSSEWREGNGLVALEMHAEHVARRTGVDVAIYGFDTGSGMPPPADFRDLPYLWQRGYFAMEAERLKARLRKAKLVLGPVEETVRNFFEREHPPPIGFIAIDLDYYSSTRNALSILEARTETCFPGIVCYVDDMVGDIDCAFNEYTGELLAIREFNESRDHIKLAQVRGLRFSERTDTQAVARAGLRRPSVHASRLQSSHIRADSASPPSRLTGWSCLASVPIFAHAGSGLTTDRSATAKPGVVLSAAWLNRKVTRRGRAAAVARVSTRSAQTGRLEYRRRWFCQ